MPVSIQKVTKAKGAVIKKGEDLQRAVEEFQHTRSLPLAPSQELLENKHGVARSTMQAHIDCRTSKIESTD